MGFQLSPATHSLDRSDPRNAALPSGFKSCGLLDRQFGRLCPFTILSMWPTARAVSQQLARFGELLAKRRSESLQRLVRGPPSCSGNRGCPSPGLRAPRRPETSGQWSEFDVDRREGVDERAELQLAVREVDAKDCDAVGVLVGRIEERPRRVDVHPARPLPARRFPSDHVELTRVRVDLEDRDAVVTAVRGVEELSIRVDTDLRGGVEASAPTASRWSAARSRRLAPGRRRRR